MSAKSLPPTRRVLTPTETQGFNDAIQDHEGRGKEGEMTYVVEGHKTNDPQINRMKGLLKNSNIGGLNKSEKAAKEARSEVLKKWLRGMMVPRSHISLRPQKDGVQSYEFRKAASHMAEKEMSAEFQNVAQEYKNIMRELERPEEANLEAIRPDSI